MYRRLTRTVDLTAVTAAQAPKLEAQLNTTPRRATTTSSSRPAPRAARTGRRCRTRTAHTSTTVPAECEAGFLLSMHPQLTHYLTGGNPCANTGSSGSGTRSPGSSAGWVPVAFDLSAYAGKQVEVSIAYVSDPFTGGAGLFIDDTRVTTSGGELDAEGFETGLGPWTIAGAPEGSPGNAAEFVRSEAVIDRCSAVVTRDSVLLGLRPGAGRQARRPATRWSAAPCGTCCADRRPR